MLPLFHHHPVCGTDVDNDRLRPFGRQSIAVQPVQGQSKASKNWRLSCFHSPALFVIDLHDLLMLTDISPRHHYEKQQQHLVFVISWEEQTGLLFDISDRGNFYILLMLCGIQSKGLWVSKGSKEYGLQGIRTGLDCAEHDQHVRIDKLKNWTVTLDKEQNLTRALAVSLIVKHSIGLFIKQAAGFITSYYIKVGDAQPVEYFPFITVLTGLWNVHNKAFSKSMDTSLVYRLHWLWDDNSQNFSVAIVSVVLSIATRPLFQLLVDRAKTNPFAMTEIVALLRE
ncbi:hypothetical protein T10_11065 [Trichinella papuae]|uniref:Uncharacterized protein n=1 Tax=Trichinella papuae TaxID=268474 RepID=A0A0V1M5N9_9BILA|nr:hypothetical protein T10_11065 [Trichinella papuae]